MTDRKTVHLSLQELAAKPSADMLETVSSWLNDAVAHHDVYIDRDGRTTEDAMRPLRTHGLSAKAVSLFGWGKPKDCKVVEWLELRDPMTLKGSFRGSRATTTEVAAKVVEEAPPAETVVEEKPAEVVEEVKPAEDKPSKGKKGRSRRRAGNPETA